MKRILLLGGIVVAGALWGAAPRIVENSATWSQSGTKVSITYALADAPGIVTAEVFTNGVSLGAAAIAAMTGDVNALVEPGANRRISWTIRDSWPDAPEMLLKGGAAVKLRVTPETLPPDYMCVDLASGAVNYYVSSNALPGGVQADVYRKTKMVFRRIPAANRIWRMGDSGCYDTQDEPYRSYNRTRLVTLTYDYWTSIYELTHAQVKAITGGWAAARVTNVTGKSDGVTRNRQTWISEDDWSMCPADGESIAALRGDPAVAAYQWPDAGRAGVAPTSLLGVLRARTQAATGRTLYFDMPTSAEWEYAARGGSHHTEPWGSDGLSSAEIALRAWSSTNAKTDAFEDQYGAGRTHRVGELEPNAWGLYDMLGNLYEVVLDYLPDEAYRDMVDQPHCVDPVGVLRSQAKPNGGAFLRKVRGGAYSDGYAYCRPTYVANNNVSEAYAMNQWFGHRIVCPIAWKPRAASVAGDTPAIAFDAETREATITYRLTGTEPRIVTLDVRTNGVSIGEANFAYLGGDVNKVVEPGDHVVYWRPDHTWAGHYVETAKDSLSVEVKTWTTNNPPDYLVLNLAGSMTPMYYVSSNAVPGGVGAAAYKEDNLLMRRIPAAGVTWRMGCNRQYWRDQERARMTTLTQDFWIGVYGITQRQYYELMKAAPAAGFYGSGSSGDLPLCGLLWSAFRGGSWPSANGHADIGADTWIARARALYPALAFDYPTEAQREFAARGGTSAVSQDGVDSFPMDAAGKARHARYAWFSDSNANDPEWIDNAPHRVGLLAPNGYGLYDMCGNLLEFCLDLYEDNTAPADGSLVVDPEGPATSSLGARATRGCAFSDGVGRASLTYRTNVGLTAGGDRWRGHRVVAPINP